MNIELKIYHMNMNLLCAMIVSAFILLPSSFTVAASLSPEDILKKHIVEKYPWKDIEISNIKVTGKLQDEVPAYILVEKGPIGRAIFSFLYKTKNKVTVKAHVRAFDQIVKNKRPFRKGHVIQQDDIYIERMDIRRMPTGAVKWPEILLGKSLRRSIIANIPMVEGMVEHAQVVKRGKTVMLLINRNGLKITAAGKIKEKGYVGSPVRAVNLSSHKEVSGVLIDENTVEILL